MGALRQVAVWPRALRVALQFMTRLPLHMEPPPEPREMGLSLACYPVVGLVLGMLLWGVALAVSRLPALLGAAMVLAVWVLVTGALHIDGLADTADAWVGGHGDRDRTLDIMKDPRSGPVALAAVNCLLLLKFAALAALMAHLHAVPLHALPLRVEPWRDAHLAAACILPPMLARAAIPLLFARTPYVRAQGIAEQLMAHQSRGAGAFAMALTALCALAAWRAAAAVAMGAAAVAYGIVRRGLMRRLGGFTGDGAGALIEVIEAACLVALAAAP
jgi:adenosylcobinamide-GDP ribazoletransferase